MFVQTPLHLAAKGGHKEVAELLFNRGADIDAEARSGGTPPYFAAEGIEAEDNQHETPLSLAVKGKHQNVATMLRNRGATQ